MSKISQAQENFCFWLVDWNLLLNNVLIMSAFRCLASPEVVVFVQPPGRSSSIMPDKGILIARPVPHLPEYLRRRLEDEQLQQEAEQRETRWHTGALISFVAVLAIMMLFVVAVSMAAKSSGKWVALPMGLAGIPLMWLAYKAMFDTFPREQEPPQKGVGTLPSDWRKP